MKGTLRSSQHAAAPIKRYVARMVAVQRVSISSSDFGGWAVDRSKSWCHGGVRAMPSRPHESPRRRIGAQRQAGPPDRGQREGLGVGAGGASALQRAMGFQDDRGGRDAAVCAEE